MRDRSLEEFLDDSAGGDETLQADGSDPLPESPDADPTRLTCAWTPDGADCEDCGTTVKRRWRDGDRLVCTDCKAW
jgi:hypothetical protein